MIIELLDKATLALLNRQPKFPLAVAEKDYFLAAVCKVLYDSPLKSSLIFKGGTAIYHTYLPQLRFSEDLDFSSNQRAIDPQEIKSVFAGFDFFECQKRLSFFCNLQNREALLCRAIITTRLDKS